MNGKHWIVVGLIAAMAGAAWAADAEQEKEGVAVTVYNGGYCVVREIRSLDIAADGSVKFTDVARNIDATTVHFKSLTDPDAKLLEQNYQYDLVSADKLLQKYIDQPIEVVCEGKTYAGSLMSFDGAQLVLKQADGKIVMVQRPQNVRDIRFSALPGGLLTRPTLLWAVATKKPGKQLAEVTYQAGGISWHAEYVLVLSGDDTTADLSGWVSVQNNSGKTYNDAKMKFIAGDVRRVEPRRNDLTIHAGMRTKAMAPEPMEEKAFFEYHMYALPRPAASNATTAYGERWLPARLENSHGCARRHAFHASTTTADSQILERMVFIFPEASGPNRRADVQLSSTLVALVELSSSVVGYDTTSAWLIPPRFPRRGFAFSRNGSCRGRGRVFRPKFRPRRFGLWRRLTPRERAGR